MNEILRPSISLTSRPQISGEMSSQVRIAVHKLQVILFDQIIDSSPRTIRRNLRRLLKQASQSHYEAWCGSSCSYGSLQPRRSSSEHFLGLPPKMQSSRPHIYDCSRKPVPTRRQFCVTWAGKLSYSWKQLFLFIRIKGHFLTTITSPMAMASARKTCLMC